MAFAVTEEFIELAVELIDEFVEEPNATWVSIPNDAVADPDKPWEVTRGDETEHDVRIVFLQDDLEDRQLLRYLKATETTTGQINGIMYKHDFTPKQKDVVKFNGQELVVKAIDDLIPFDETIVYFLEFGS